MGIQFVTYVEDEIRWVGNMGNTKAKTFMEFTNLMSQWFNLPLCLNFEMTGSDECLIDKEIFCEMVERAVQSSNVFLYGWASQAAGIYESIIGEQCTWIWDENKFPIVPFTPTNTSDLVPPIKGNRTIAHR